MYSWILEEVGKRKSEEEKKQNTQVFSNIRSEFIIFSVPTLKITDKKGEKNRKTSIFNTYVRF